MRRYPPPNASQPSDPVLDKGDLAFLLEKNEDKAINTRNIFFRLIVSCLIAGCWGLPRSPDAKANEFWLP